MPILLKIKQEIEDFSGWFKIVLGILFVVYIFFWFFTIHLYNVQKAGHIQPVLPVIAEDSEEYDQLSQSIISGNGFSRNGNIETLRTPGYPLFVSFIKVVGKSYFAVTLVQIFLIFISAFFIRKIGILFASKRVGEISSLLFLINPVTLALSLVLLADTLFLFLFILGFYLAVSLKNERILFRTFMMSIFFSLTIYIRMGLFALPLIFLPILASPISVKNKIKSMLLTTLILTIAVSPWILRNYLSTGVAGFSSFRAVNIAWVIPKFVSSLNGTDLGQESSNFEKIIGVKELGYRDIRLSDKINSAAEKIILERPFAYIKYHLVTSIPFLFPSSVLFARDVYNSTLHIKPPFEEGIINFLAAGDFKSFFGGILKVWWKFAERICWLLVYIIALFGIWNKRRNLLTWSFVFTIGYLMLLAGPAAGPRLSLQAWPFIFILFVPGLTYLFKKFNLRNI
jgi:4-amino-4-deoxy-L-arabinose transferase-like glycosyltransferase